MSKPTNRIEPGPSYAPHMDRGHPSAASKPMTAGSFPAGKVAAKPMVKPAPVAPAPAPATPMPVGKAAKVSPAYSDKPTKHAKGSRGFKG